MEIISPKNTEESLLSVLRPLLKNKISQFYATVGEKPQIIILSPSYKSIIDLLEFEGIRVLYSKTLRNESIQVF